MSNIQDMTIAEEFSLKVKQANFRNRLTRIAPIIVLILLVITFGALNKSFLSFENLGAIISQLSIPLVVAVGVTFVVLMGSIDLSVDGVMGLAAAVVSLLIANSKNMVDLGVFGVLLALLLSALIGFATGVIQVKAKIPSFIVTFGMSSVAAGIALLTYGGKPALIEAGWFRAIALNTFLGLPIFAWIAFLVFAAVYIIQEYTAFGRYIYAIGDREMIPRQAGVNVDRIKIMAFTLSGLCIGLGGILGTARLGRGAVDVGKDNLFPVMTAIVVGGTSLSGGKGGVQATLLGVLIVTVLQNGLVLMGVDPYIQAGLQGAVIIAAVAVSVTRNRKNITK